MKNQSSLMGKPCAQTFYSRYIYIDLRFYKTRVFVRN